MKFVNVNVYLIQVEMKIEAGVNSKNWLIKEVVIKDLFGFLLSVSVNAINHVMVENI